MSRHYCISWHMHKDFQLDSRQLAQLMHASMAWLLQLPSRLDRQQQCHQGQRPACIWIYPKKSSSITAVALT
jgi:hypothetical protein